MKRVIQVLVCLFIPFCLCGQYILELHSVSDDSFGEWEILLEKDSIEVEGELRLTWGMGNDFSAWQYSVDDLYGEISLKFKNNPGHWELRSEDIIVTIKQVWPGDPTEWKISYDKRSFTFRTVYSNQLDEWSNLEQELGQLTILTDTQGDPRDWIIHDYMLDDITFEERMASVFIGLITSIPQR
jgi:hypothetical protein